MLGAAPGYDFMFAVSAAVHEALVYVAAVQRLFASRLAPPVGFLPQLAVDLSRGTPRLEFLSDPPVYAPNGVFLLGVGLLG